MALIDKIKNTTRKAAEVTKEKAVQFADATSKKAAQIAAITRIKSKINNENANISELKLTIGSYCYAQYEAASELDPQIFELCKKIEESLKAIAELNVELEAAKQGEPEND